MASESREGVNLANGGGDEGTSDIGRKKKK
jgi:hypothetical protein